jgi:hypothetical protein
MVVAEHFPRPAAGKTASPQTRTSKKNIECEKMLCFGWEAEQFLKRTKFSKPEIIRLNRDLFEITWEFLCHYGSSLSTEL